MNQKKSALCVVAHPDDETIWMGGTILKNWNWNWTILSLCRENDFDRAPKFMRVCESLHAKPLISDLDDEVLQPLSSTVVEKKILQALPKKSYDYIFTHGQNGEYGHLRHEEIHNAIKNLVDKREINCAKLMYFSYSPGPLSAPHDPDLKIPMPNPNADISVSLTNSQFDKKFDLLTNTYGFKHPIFETLSCNKTEAFTYN